MFEKTLKSFKNKVYIIDDKTSDTEYSIYMV